MTTDKMPKSNGRFQKGKSGNPKGRPRKGGKGTDPTNILNQAFKVEFQGEELEVSAQIAAMLALFSSGLENNDAAALEACLNHSKRLPTSEPPPSQNISITTWVIESAVDSALADLGICENSEGLCCVPDWLIEEALKRDPAPNLDERDLSTLSATASNKPAARDRLDSAQRPSSR